MCAFGFSAGVDGEWGENVLRAIFPVIVAGAGVPTMTVSSAVNLGKTRSGCTVAIRFEFVPVFYFFNSAGLRFVLEK